MQASYANDPSSMSGWAIGGVALVIVSQRRTKSVSKTNPQKTLETTEVGGVSLPTLSCTSWSTHRLPPLAPSHACHAFAACFFLAREMSILGPSWELIPEMNGSVKSFGSSHLNKRRMALYGSHQGMLHVLQCSDFHLCSGISASVAQNGPQKHPWSLRLAQQVEYCHLGSFAFCWQRLGVCLVELLVLAKGK